MLDAFIAHVNTTSAPTGCRQSRPARPTAHVQTNDGDVDRPVPRQRDRARHPAQTHRLPSLGQPLDPGLRQRRQFLGRRIWSRRSKQPGSDDSRTSTNPHNWGTHRLRPRRRADAADLQRHSAHSPSSRWRLQPSNEPCSARPASPSDSASSTTVSWTRTTPSARPASKTPSSPKATRDHYRIGVVPIDAPTALSAPNTYRSGPQSGAPCSRSSTRQDCRPAAKKRLQRELGEVEAILDKTDTTRSSSDQRPDTSHDPQHDEGVSPAPPNACAMPWIDYWPGARNAPTEG